MRSPKPPLHKAFTLIELLVVIAIIAMLAAILFPVFGRARENARRSSCSSNLRQIGIGIMSYVQDNDERYPLSSLPRTGPFASVSSSAEFADTSNVQYPHIIGPYMKSMQVFHCPSGRIKGDGVYGHYGVNIAVMPAFSAANPKSLAAASVINAGGTYVIMDLGAYRMNAATLKSPPVTSNAGEYIPGTGPGSSSNLASVSFANSVVDLDGDYKRGRHFEGVNVTFADGHVKWLKSEVVLREAAKCPTNCDATKSAWNPLLDNS